MIYPGPVGHDIRSEDIVILHRSCPRNRHMPPVFCVESGRTREREWGVWVIERYPDGLCVLQAGSINRVKHSRLVVA